MKKDSIDEKFDKQLLEDIENLSVLESGSEERSREVDNVTKMMRARDEKKNGVRTFLLGVAGVVIGLGTYIFSEARLDKRYYDGLHYEETGALVSKTFSEDRRRHAKVPFMK